MSTSARLLQLAIPLVKTHGFTRDTLSRSVLHLQTPHAEPLPETAVSSLFGPGDDARRTLINAWLGHALCQMKTVSSPTMKETLRLRLECNESVLQYLPEAFALLASPSSGFPPLDLRPALKHSVRIADEACYIAGDTSMELSWYWRRASLAAIYTAAELHQLTSPKTAYTFLDSLLDASSVLKSSLDEVELYSSYIVKSWTGIIKSSGVF